MERKNNYYNAREESKKLFLALDIEKIAKNWGLTLDDEYLYLRFFGIPYRVRRSDASVLRDNPEGGEPIEGGFEETLSIFDLLNHGDPRPSASGTFATVNRRPGKPVSIGVGDGEFFSRFAAEIDKDPEAFRQSCLKAGGTEISLGDMGFEFTVFEDLKIRIKFYYSDDEFPASLTCLWDESTLSYFLYETTYYALGFFYNILTKG
ncbi:MAG: DUF3786 domain-containing protein [Oscillospiraceae bacterium]|nr:DUF3786 domain-containing protein [Oscillospiraceae bacterium]